MTSKLFDLTGKTAIVSGANTGLGQGIALALGSAGAAVVGLSRSDDAETAAQMQALGYAYHGIRADLKDYLVVDKVISEVIEKFGGFNILVNNAGIIRRAEALDFSMEDWQDVLDINLKSLFYFCRQAGRHFLANGGGKIINIASLLSFQGGIRVPAYTAAKSAVKGLTMALANEWAGKGICVNAIAPGYFVTNNTQAIREDPKRYEAILARIPAERWGQPSDLAGAVIFLASPASDYVHGITLPVDGGWLGR